MWASAGVHRAKEVVEQHADDNNVRLRRLVGEAELCLLWESVRSGPGDVASRADGELRAWMDKWSAFCGRGMCVSRFCLSLLPVDLPFFKRRHSILASTKNLCL